MFISGFDTSTQLVADFYGRGTNSFSSLQISKSSSVAGTTSAVLKVLCGKSYRCSKGPNNSYSTRGVTGGVSHPNS